MMEKETWSATQTGKNETTDNMLTNMKDMVTKFLPGNLPSQQLLNFLGILQAPTNKFENIIAFSFDMLTIITPSNLIALL